MRRRYRKKRRSCGVCKPDKKGLAVRWTNRQLAQLKEFERDRHKYMGRS